MQTDTKPRNRARTIALIVAGVFGVLLLVAVVGSSPSVCATCHGEAVAVQEESAHASTGCYECHASTPTDLVAFKAYEMLRMYPRGLFGLESSGPVRETPRAACLECHASVLASTLPGVSGIRIAHAPCAPEASCDGCHATVAHGEAVRWPRQPIMEDCTACHTALGGSNECETCHIGDITVERLEEGPWQVTHGPNWQQTHGMGALDSCVTCHPDDYCVRCHDVEVPHDATFGARHGAEALTMTESCEVCHRSRAFCDACHGIDMPHSDDYIVIHPDEAGVKDNPQCMRCHALEDCESCHIRHVHPGGVKNGLTLPLLEGGS